VSWVTEDGPPERNIPVGRIFFNASSLFENGNI